ncbi:MAG TPA: GerMN domain-containing protein [Acidimicrobiia bacterium]|nr:GerMN domain-containing protein [Acidimicrobiia bacterium]
MSRRLVAGRLGRLVAVVVALAAAAACSAPVDAGPQTLRAASLPADLRGPAPSTTTTTLATTGESVEVTVYFISGDRLAPVKRRISPPATVTKVLQALFAGPTDAERLTGLRTAISPDTTVLGAQVEAKIVTIDVSKNFAFGQIPDQIAAFAQVVFTAVDVDGVTGVLFSLNGRRLEVPQGDGSSTSAPLGRASYPQVTPR